MFDKFKIINEMKKFKYEYFVTFIFSIFLYLSSELISRKSIILTIKWIISNPFYFLTSVVFVLALNIVLGAVFLNYKIGHIISMLIILPLSIINCIKYDLRGIPLIPSDFFLVKEVQNITNAVNLSKYTSYIIFAILLSIIATFIMRKLIYKTFSKKLRMFNFMVSLSIIFVLVCSNALADGDYLSKGFVLNFSSQIHQKNIWNNRLNYDHQLLEKIMANFKNHKDCSIDKKNDQKPNIIVIMNEAFWDLNLLKDVEITPNPMETFEELRKESIYGSMEAPVYGGGTSNTEFEVLTGFSTHYYDEGYMVYPNEIKLPLMSLASILRNQGYYTTAIHPFWGWYYNRNEVYKHLGFNQFISDEYLGHSLLKGYYVSDETATDLIIDQIKNSDDPQFVFCVTMQNHGPYDDDRYKNLNLDINIKGNLDNKSMDILRTYSQGVFDANKGLGRLISYLKQEDKPTILLFFGDHPPLLGEDFKVYRECGYITDDEAYYDRFIKIKTTPFILWSNFDNKSEDIGLIDATFIGSYLLNRANLEMPNYYKFLVQLYKEISVINNEFAMNNMNDYENGEKYNSYNEQLKALQLDMIYGEKKIEENYGNWIIKDNSSYNAQLNNIKINEVFIKDKDLIIKGENLYPKGTLYINNKKVQFEFVNTNQLIIRDYIGKFNSDNVIVQFKLIDTIEKVLAKDKVSRFIKFK